MVDGTGTTTYTVGSLHRLTAVTNGAGQTVRYGYDLAGRVTSLTYPNTQVVTRGYDAAGRLTMLQDWLGKSITFGYDTDGNWTTTGYPNGVTGSRGYDNADRLTEVTYGTASGVLGSYEYTRTSAGLLATTTPSGGAPGIDDTYAYTSNAQLKSTTGATSTSIWSYDAADRVTHLPTGTTLGYAAADQLTQSTPTQGDATTYTYDGRGNRSTATVGSNSTTRYGYDQANRLTSSTNPEGQTSTYTYDGDGLRAAKTPAGSTTQTMTWDPVTGAVPVLFADNTSLYVYGPADTPLEQITGTTPTYLHPDQLGSTRQLTNTSGSVTGTYTYTYGQTRDHTGTATPLQFNGQYADTETGFIYLRARYYDPFSTQFLSRDPLVILTRASYAYASGDPLDILDPTGLFDFWDGVAVAGIVVGVASLTIATGGADLIVGAGISAGILAEGATIPAAVETGISLAGVGLAAIQTGHDCIIGSTACGNDILGMGGGIAATRWPNAAGGFLGEIFSFTQSLAGVPAPLPGNPDSPCVQPEQRTPPAPASRSHSPLFPPLGPGSGG